ncbi:MAG: aldehyde dehydrogenase family protein [Deltaproteobacteria bacterium]|nr:aldehyde dehydrogenase family protein [Deltaproteobacteria bacterium]
MSQSLTIVNPANGVTTGTVPQDDAASIAKKYQEARAAQPAWAQKPLSARIAILTQFKSHVSDALEKLAHTTTGETGKPITQSRNELRGLLRRIDFFLTETESVLQTAEVHTEAGLAERISLEPLGVIGNISAWNYPYFVGSNVFIPALLTGNAVLYKPSEYATQTGLALTHLLIESGVPSEVFAPVIGRGDVGALLLQQPLNGVFFTGSYATGVRVATAAAGQLMKVQLELGGKDPIYVTDDVDIANVAAATADGAFYNAGQSCCAVERIYVHEAIHDAFVEAFVDTIRGFVIGDPLDDATYIGPLTRAEQLAVLADQVADAVNKGATLRIGGNRIERPGNYFAPTVLTDVDHRMKVMRDESFGPIIGIQKVHSDAEAMACMADTPYGLTAGVYSRTVERAQPILQAMQTGSVYWNCCDRVSPGLPWSGRGHSGIGSTLGKAGIAAFVQPKAWHLRG